MLGVDIANYQGRPDLLTARSAGERRFCIILATDGGDFTNPLLADQVAAARAAGMLLGFYHYFRPAESPIDQLRHFLSAIEPHRRDGDPLCLDVEEDGPDLPALVNLWVGGCKQRMAVAPLLYLNRDFIDRYDWANLARQCHLWLAAWQMDDCPAGYGPWGSVTVWQDSGGAAVPGIGWCDTDQFFGAASDWLALGTPDAAPLPQSPAEPPDGTGYTLAINERGEAVLTINFGGRWARVKGIAGDVGITGVNDAGHQYHRTFRTQPDGSFAPLDFVQDS